MCKGDFPGDSDGKASAYNTGDPVWSLGWEDSLDKEMATHSSIFAWKIPWTEEPGGLQSMGSQRVRQKWATNILTFYFRIQITYVPFIYFPILSQININITGFNTFYNEVSSVNFSC